MLGPATFVMLLLVGLLLVLGALVVSNAAHPRATRPGAPAHRACPACGHANVPAAGFCARCGAALRPH